MDDIRKFDQYLFELARKLEKHPDFKSRIILEAMRSAACPYLRRKIKELG